MTEQTMDQQALVKERAATAELTRPPESLWRDAWRRLLRNKAAIAGGLFVILVTVFAVFADDWFIAWAQDRSPEPFLAPYHWKDVQVNPAKSLTFGADLL